MLGQKTQFMDHTILNIPLGLKQIKCLVTVLHGNPTGINIGYFHFLFLEYSMTIHSNINDHSTNIVF